MFEKIDKKIKARMSFLEATDKKDRENGTPRMKRLRQIPPGTGRFISLVASICPEGNFIEIGTSAGYSTLWLSLAVRERNNKIITFELLPEKIGLAKETFRLTGTEKYIELVEGDALENLDIVNNISFCFLDTEKEIYEACWDIISDKIIGGGVLIADNVISHRETLQPLVDKILQDSRFDSVVVPIGKGELFCRRKKVI